MSAQRVLAWILVLVAGFCLFDPRPVLAGSENRQIEAILVWATNEECVL